MGVHCGGAVDSTVISHLGDQGLSLYRSSVWSLHGFFVLQVLRFQKHAKGLELPNCACVCVCVCLHTCACALRWVGTPS